MLKLDITDLNHYYKQGCLRCGRPTGLVDLDTYIELEGHLALCAGCLGEAANLAGYTLTEKFAERLATAERLRDEALAARDEAESAIESLQRSYQGIRARKARTDKEASHAEA